jgi:hypothetical protein
MSYLFIIIAHIIDPLHGKTVETMFRTSDFASHISHFAYAIQKSVGKLCLQKHSC